MHYLWKAVSDLVSLLFWTTLDLKHLIFDNGKFGDHLSLRSQSVSGVFPSVHLYSLWIPPASCQSAHVYHVQKPLTKAGVAQVASATGVAYRMGEVGLQLWLPQGLGSRWVWMCRPHGLRLSERARMVGILELGGVLPPCSAFASPWSWVGSQQPMDQS